MKQKLRKPLAWILTLTVLFTMLPGVTFTASAADHLCEHHAAHTAECGYAEGVHDCAYHCDVCLGHGGETDSEAVCDCGTDDESIHATTCAAYVQPENPVCYCAVPCTEANEWCDICGFDYTACTGTEEAAAYFTPPTGRDNLLYTGEAQVLINPGRADADHTWWYYRYGSSGDPLVTLPETSDPPTAANVDRYTVNCYHVDNSDTEDPWWYGYYTKADASVTVYIYPVVSTDPVAATGLVADGTAKTLITSEGKVSGGQNGDVLYAVTGSSATKPGEFSTALPTATEPGTYKVWFKAWAQGPDRDPAPWGVTAPDSAARSITVTIAGANACAHDSYQNGFCDCGAYQPAVDSDSDGYYEIGNAGQLFWFAKQINEVDRTFSAVLTDDIDLEGRRWTPIGATGQDSHNFRGHFDGRGHTVKGLYVEGGRAGLGFFGEVRTGTVENFTIYGEVVVNTQDDYVGGVIGSACGLNNGEIPDRNGATIRNITSYVDLTAGAHGIGMVGGFIGYANHETLIENCAWYGTFDAGIYRVDSGAGGFIGRIYDSSAVTIRNCGAYGEIITGYQSGTFNNQDTIYIGGFLSYSSAGAETVLENNLWAGKIINNTNLAKEKAHLSAYGTLTSVKRVENCYMQEGSAACITTGDTNTGGISSVTTDELESGEVAYLLGAAWGQTLGTDDYPVPGGRKVYRVRNCKGETVYSNTDENIDHIVENDVCTVCGANQSAEVYEISNAEQLYWFADQVNNGNVSINAKLTADIVVNENVLINGALVSDPSALRVWTPIGNAEKQYAGTFDGNGKTISGLYFNDSTAYYVGLFGFLSGGVVKNVSVSDSYLYGFGYVGGIVGYAKDSSAITGCTNNAFVGSVSNYVGGIAASVENNISIIGCTNTGRVTGNATAGGIVGYAAGSSSIKSIIKNCRNSGEVSGPGGNVGGIVGLFKYTTAENCCNTGDLSGRADGSGSGGISGFNDWGVSSSNSYYLDTCGGGGRGTAKTAAQFASGEVAYLLQGEQTEQVWGQTIGEDAYPILGGERVYYGYTSCAKDAVMGYTNDPDASAEKPIHAYDPVTGACANCDDVSEGNTGLWVGGTQFTSENLTIRDENGGTATYDLKTGTLTLNGYNYSGAGYTDEDGVSAAIYSSGTLRLELVGSNTVEHTGGEGSSSRGIAVYGTLEISGTGSLTAVAADTPGSAGVQASGLTLGEGIQILIPVSGSFDAEQETVVSGTGFPLKKVVIGAAPSVERTDDRLTVTNTLAGADEAVDMVIMVAGYTGGRMNGCQVVENVTGVTEIDLTVTGDTVKVFFLESGTYVPLFDCAEL